MKNSSASRRIEQIIQYLQYLASIVAITLMVYNTQVGDKRFINAAIGIVAFSAACFLLQIILLNISNSIEARLLTEFDNCAFEELFSIGDKKKRNPNITHYRNIGFADFINDAQIILLSDYDPIVVEVSAMMIAKCSKLKKGTLVSVIAESSDGVNRCKGILFLDGLFSWWLKDTVSEDNTRKAELSNAEKSFDDLKK